MGAARREVGMTAVVMLPPADRDKLAKLLGMLGSDHPGERDNAAVAADRLVRQRGLTWPDVLQPQIVESWTQPPQPPPPPPDEPVGWRQIARQCLLYPQSMNDWERHFLIDLSRRRSLSPKQMACLQRIADRVLGEDDW
jgi:hypothetical protein